MVDTGAGVVNLGETKHLPPTLSVLYYFDTNSAIKPYMGVGINYTIFFEDSFKCLAIKIGLIFSLKPRF